MSKISVVVSSFTKERFHYVSECIHSLKTQSMLPAEILLVLDPDEELLEFYKSKTPPDVKIVTSEKPGLSYARNAGIEKALGDVVAFIDDDAIADEKWLENLDRNYEDPQVLGVGGLIKPLWENRCPAWFPEELGWVVGCSYKGLPERKARIRNPIGCNMAFRKTVFEEVGYFNTKVGRIGNKLSSHEDTEFSIRVMEKFPGHKILYDPFSIVLHRVPKSRISLRYVIRRSFFEGFSKAVISKEKPKSENVLDVERNYLKRLLSDGIARRLARCYKSENLLQGLVLLLSASLVVMGYFVGKNT